MDWLAALYASIGNLLHPAPPVIEALPLIVPVESTPIGRWDW